jgi:hypothetical protein
MAAADESLSISQIVCIRNDDEKSVSGGSRTKNYRQINLIKLAGWREFVFYIIAAKSFWAHPACQDLPLIKANI